MPHVTCLNIRCHCKALAGTEAVLWLSTSDAPIPLRTYLLFPVPPNYVKRSRRSYYMTFLSKLPSFGVWRCLGRFTVTTVLEHPVIHWLIALRLSSSSYGADAPRPLLTDSLCPISIYGSPVLLLRFQMAATLTLNVLWVQEEGAQIRMSEWSQGFAPPCY